MKWSLGSTVPLLFLAMTAAHADIVFNTLGPGNTYVSGSAFTIRGSSAGGLFESAAQFTAAAGGQLSEIDLGLTLNPGGAVDVYLYGDAGGSPDNLSQILLGTVTPTQAFGTTNNSIVSLVPSGTVTVNQGSTYWLVLKPDSGTTWDAWNRSSGVTGLENVSTDDVNWNFQATTLAAFQVVAVPEPGSAVLSALVLVLLIGHRLFRARRCKIAGR
jgi:hypothetical protein